ncbi:DUF2206 domain-containing protein [Halobaculum marinum]|uniref:DUF2206 domain-containing protein n=1 Tax=Halobaculum marinum TaxID=3031996 RepID=A0ABD5WQP9_9EURY
MGGVIALLSLYWVCLLVSGFLPAAVVPLALLTVPLVTLVPGGLLTILLDLTPRSVSGFAVYAVSLGVATVTVLVVATSVMFPLVGIERPLSPVVFGSVLTVTIAALTAGVYRRGTTVPRLRRPRPFPMAVALVALPSVAALAAGIMNRTGSAVGMYVLVASIVAVVLLTPTEYVPRSLYPLTVFSVGTATLLHRNLLTSYVLGADVQGLVATAERVAAAGVWSPEVSGVAVPAVTAVPAAVAALSGLGVHTTFKLFNVFAFAFVPLGVYLLGRDVFDETVGLYGALLLVFYHYTFAVTPGKQLISQLFVVGLLLTLRANDRGVVDDARTVIAVALPATGLIFAHYGTTYAIGTALLAASVVVTMANVRIDGYERRLDIAVPALLLLAATAWYWAADADTLAVLVSIPAVAVDQTTALLFAQSTAEGSGASYVASQTGPIEMLNVLLYVVVTVLLVVGVAARGLVSVNLLRRGEAPADLDYTALAVPLVALLAASYLLSLNLWADRVYQLVLVVLAPFVPYGYRVLDRGAERIGDRWRSPTWGFLATLLAALIVVNSGAAFALTGSASTSTFNPHANDRVFDGQDRAGVSWIGVHANITDVDPERSSDESRVSVDDPGNVQVFTDSVSAQLFRSMLPAEYTTVDVVVFKSEWRPVFDRDSIRDGYVYLRRPAVKEAAETGELPPTSISRRNARSITVSENVVYSNGVVEVVQTGNATG